jgi:DNA-binding XRE family transcriptional regulator
MTGFDITRMRLTMSMTQSQLAKLTNKKQSTISKAENESLIPESFAVIINMIFDDWKKNRIYFLEQEIKYLKSL